MEADHGSESSESAYVAPNCSVAEAMKLISHPFDGDKRRLREFIENVYVAFELVHPNKHEIRGLLEKYPTFGREKETGLLGALDT